MKISVQVECADLEELEQVKEALAGMKDKKLPLVKVAEAPIPRQFDRPDGKRLIPLPKWNNYHPWPSIGGLRHFVFFADSNGFKSCIKRVGRCILIDENAFFDWVDNRQVKA